MILHHLTIETGHVARRKLDDLPDEVVAVCRRVLAERRVNSTIPMLPHCRLSLSGLSCWALGLRITDLRTGHLLSAHWGFRRADEAACLAPVLPRLLTPDEMPACVSHLAIGIAQRIDVAGAIGMFSGALMLVWAHDQGDGDL